MKTFINTGIYTQGCIVPITTEDPSLTVLETKPNSKNWGIGFFIGEPTAENCIGLISDETSINSIDRSILKASVYNREGQIVGSVYTRLLSRRNVVMLAEEV